MTTSYTPLFDCDIVTVVRPDPRDDLAAVRKAVTLNIAQFRPEAVVVDEDEGDAWLPGISEPEDVGLNDSPEVRVYGGVTWELDKLGMKFLPGNPFRPVVKGEAKTVVGDSQNVVYERSLMHDEEFRYCNRDQSDAKITQRWNQPDDVLDVLDEIEDDPDGRAMWFERMTTFRREELHRLLKVYFQTEDYSKCKIVLKWERVNGRHRPSEEAGSELPVLRWISEKVEEKGSQLAGFASCAGTIRKKLEGRAKAQAKNEAKAVASRHLADGKIDQKRYNKVVGRIATAA